MKNYIYRSFPCNVVLDDQLWYVAGYDNELIGGGVLEWCYSENDAKHRLSLMSSFSRFENLTIRKFRN